VQVASTPVADTEVDAAAREMLRQLARGQRLEPMLRRLLLDALLNEDRGDGPRDPDALVSDAARSATEWIGASAEEREMVLRELLTLTDALRPDPQPGPSLPEKFLTAHRCLQAAEIPHAMGGALAVGYYGEPRSTLDIDVNVFVPADRWGAIREVLGPLGADIEVDESEIERVGESKLGWGSNFIHLFFSSDPFHEEMRECIRRVPFDGETIPIVSPEHLVIRKALLDRTKDWLDIEQILVATSPLDLEEVKSWLMKMIGEDDPRVEKLNEVKAALSLS
jgi:hypothetical protein